MCPKLSSSSSCTGYRCEASEPDTLTGTLRAAIACSKTGMKDSRPTLQEVLGFRVLDLSADRQFRRPDRADTGLVLQSGKGPVVTSRSCGGDMPHYNWLTKAVARWGERQT